MEQEQQVQEISVYRGGNFNNPYFVDGLDDCNETLLLCRHGLGEHLCKIWSENLEAFMKYEVQKICI